MVDIIKFHLLDNLMEDSRRLWYIFVFNASVCEQFNVHIKNACQRSFRRRVGRTQKIAGLLERHQRGDKPTMSTAVEGSLQIAVHAGLQQVQKKLVL